MNAPTPLSMPSRRAPVAAPTVCSSCFGSGIALTTRASSTGREIAVYGSCSKCAGPVPVTYGPEWPCYCDEGAIYCPQHGGI